MSPILRILALTCLASVAACNDIGGKTDGAGTKPPTTDDNPHVSLKDPMKLVLPKDVTPATMIAYSGHEKYFDHLARPIEVDDSLVLKTEASMTEQLLELGQQKLEPKKVSELLDAQKFAQSGELKPVQAALLQGTITSRLLEVADKRFLAQFEWRHRLLMRRYTAVTLNRDWMRFYPVRFRLILERVGPWVLIPLSTDYVKRCRADDVPIPPQWSEANPNGWKLHSLLG